TNPVDTTAGVSEEQLHACVEALARAVDCVLVVLVPTALAAATGENLLRAVTHAAQHSSCTVAAVLTEQTAPVALRRSGAKRPVPAYADSQQAARALAHAVRYAQWRARPEGTVPREVSQQEHADAAGAEGGHAIAAAFLSAHPEGGWLSPHTCTQLLDHYGIPQVPWRWAEDEDAAAKAAAHLTDEGHGRVALKAYWPGLLHKSDQNAVLLDITGEQQARTAYRDLATRFAGLLKGVVIQPMAPRGIELFAGVVQDEVFGPL
uniref:acetate--CoA ligase family protein n=1 Tax=Streptomyces sp. ODS28 TaxID=3136688 RepID=UPI0031E88D1A